MYLNDDADNKNWETRQKISKSFSKTVESVKKHTSDIVLQILPLALSQGSTSCQHLSFAFIWVGWHTCDDDGMLPLPIVTSGLLVVTLKTTGAPTPFRPTPSTASPFRDKGTKGTETLESQASWGVIFLGISWKDRSIWNESSWAVVNAVLRAMSGERHGLSLSSPPCWTKAIPRFWLGWELSDTVALWLCCKPGLIKQQNRHTVTQHGLNSLISLNCQILTKDYSYWQ